MQNNVVTLETAKKLKAAGFPQGHEGDRGFWRRYDGLLHYGFDPRSSNVEWFRASTGQEIADQLPNDVAVVKYGSRWSAFIWPGSMQREKGEIGDTISEALAALWLKTREASK